MKDDVFGETCVVFWEILRRKNKFINMEKPSKKMTYWLSNKNNKQIEARKKIGVLKLIHG